MKGLKRNNAVGIKGRSGRKKLSVEMEFFRTLDKLLPKTIRYCDKLLDETDEQCEVLALNLKCQENPLVVKGILAEIMSWKNLGLRAAQVLISKAPERIAGADGNNLTIKFDNALNSTPATKENSGKSGAV